MNSSAVSSFPHVQAKLESNLCPSPRPAVFDISFSRTLRSCSGFYPVIKWSNCLTFHSHNHIFPFPLARLSWRSREIWTSQARVLHTTTRICHPGYQNSDLSTISLRSNRKTISCCKKKRSMDRLMWSPVLKRLKSASIDAPFGERGIMIDVIRGVQGLRSTIGSKLVTKKKLLREMIALPEAHAPNGNWPRVSMAHHEFRSSRPAVIPKYSR